MKLVVHMGVLLGVGLGLGLADMALRPLAESAENATDINDLIGQTDPDSGTPANTEPDVDTPEIRDPVDDGTGNTEPVDDGTSDNTEPVVDTPPDVPVVTSEPEFPRTTPGPNWPAHHVTVEQASQLFGRPDVLFVDARALDKFEEGHVQGAICLPLEAFHGQQPQILEFHTSMDFPIVVIYCGGGDCEESDAVRDLLMPDGYENVYVMHDGWPGWVKMGLPGETGQGEFEGFYDW